MVKMDLPSSQSQANSTGSKADSRITSYYQVIQSLQNYAGADDLKGTAYTASKNFGTAVFVPLYQGLIMLSDGVKSSTQEFTEGYISEVGSESLDSEDLAFDISAINLTIEHNTTLLNDAKNATKVNQKTVDNLQATIDKDKANRDKLQDKYEKLMAFHAKSPSFFDEIPGLESAVDSGLAAVETIPTDFSLPSDMTWAVTISGQWTTYQQNITDGYNAAVAKVREGKPLTNEDIRAIQRYQQAHPDVAIDDDVKKAMEAHTVEKKYQDVVVKAKNGRDLTEQDVETIEAYKKAHPNVKIDNNVQVAHNKYVEKQYKDVLDRVGKGENLTQQDVAAIYAYTDKFPGNPLPDILKKKVEYLMMQTLTDGKNLYESAKDFNESDWGKRINMMAKAYPASAMKAFLKSDGFWEIANALPSSMQDKLISALAKYEGAGNILKVDKIGKAYDKIQKGISAATSPIKTLVSDGLKKVPGYKLIAKGGKLSNAGKVLTKVGTVLTYLDLGITGAASAVDEFSKSGHVGKAAASGTLDALKSVGPLEGATIGASIAGAFTTVAIPIPGLGTLTGAAAGAVIGGIAGSVNTIAQLVFPNLYSDAKKLSHTAIDTSVGVAEYAVKKGAEVGKGIVEVGKKAVKGAGELVNDIGKAIKSIKLPSLGW